jgi:para-aminobenzoate synthetase component 1
MARSFGRGGAAAEAAWAAGPAGFACEAVGPERGAPSPLAVLAAAEAAGLARPFLLESALAAPELGGAFTFAGFEPSAIVRGTAAAGSGDPLAALEAALERALPGREAGALRAAREAVGLPFAGGAVGFLGYDLGRRLERIAPRDGGPGARDDQRFPALLFAIYPHVLARPAAGGPWRLAGLAAGFDRARERVERVLAAAAREGEGPPLRPLAARPAARTFSREAYERAVERAIELIRAGDLFEVNLSQRFEVEVREPPLALYRRLRARAAAPFCAYLRDGPRAVLSLSPERFLRKAGRQVETWPIKGTRPRGATPAEDEALARALAGSAKDRAELAMIVDLARNDLGRVAEAGSVRVAAAAELRSFPTVHHLVGRIEARLSPGRGPFDLIRAAFPGGSITGAPKVRAMEVIDELEPTRRSVYCGSIGWVGLDGDLDLSIAIRTVLVDGARCTFQAGGAVTAESDPAGEHDETIAKARAIAAALGAEIA